MKKKPLFEKILTALMVIIIIFIITAMLSTPRHKSPGKTLQKYSQANLKQAGQNILASIENAMIISEATLPPLGKDTDADGIVDTPNSALEGLPTHCPFYKLPYTYSKEKIGDYTIDAGQPIPPSILKDTSEAKFINILIIQGAKGGNEDGAPKYAPLKPFALRGDLSVGDQN